VKDRSPDSIASGVITTGDQRTKLDETGLRPHQGWAAQQLDMRRAPLLFVVDSQ
jgi:hypothetical protein